MTSTSTTPAQHEVRNGHDQKIVFDGSVIGHASSRREGSPRWTEVTIFKCDTGEYVVSKVGRTSMAHRPDARCARPDYEVAPGLHPARTPCPRCKPETDAAVALERDLYSAKVARDARGAVAACYSEDGQGLFYLTLASEDALRMASEVDDAVWSAFTALDPSSLRDRLSTR